MGQSEAWKLYYIEHLLKGSIVILELHSYVRVKGRFGNWVWMIQGERQKVTLNSYLHPMTDNTSVLIKFTIQSVS